MYRESSCSFTAGTIPLLTSKKLHWHDVARCSVEEVKKGSTLRGTERNLTNPPPDFKRQGLS